MSGVSASPLSGGLNFFTALCWRSPFNLGLWRSLTCLWLWLTSRFLLWGMGTESGASGMFLNTESVGSADSGSTDSGMSPDRAASSGTSTDMEEPEGWVLAGEARGSVRCFILPDGVCTALRCSESGRTWAWLEAGPSFSSVGLLNRISRLDIWRCLRSWLVLCSHTDMVILFPLSLLDMKELEGLSGGGGRPSLTLPWASSREQA